MHAPQMSLFAAKNTVGSAEKKASELGVKATIVVVDRGGEQVAMARMDGAWPGGFDLAIGKAQTARSFHAPSAAFVPMIQPGADLFTVSNVNAGKYVVLPGGLPIEIDGWIVGAVGVSGGSSEQDVEIARAAVEKCMQGSPEGTTKR